MNRNITAAAAAGLFMATALAGPVQAQTVPEDLPFEVIIPDYAEDPEAALAVAARRNAWRETFERQDVEGMMSFYVPEIYSYDLMAAPEADGLKLAFDGEDIWRRNWVAFFDMFEDDLEVTIENLTVYQSGDIATVRGLTRLQGTMTSGQYVDMWSRETNVLRRIDGAWLVVHDHVSVPMDFATGQALTTLSPD
ncbi:MAG: ketosteroid isomerase-like protein [Brevundimonas sp.]|jgi:ketosteroid isomerase-like protein|uniref:YybH family protein n=1 Tax=Brevundimonas sp. TaxID=1871086 RepID=UPI0039E3C134